MSSGEEYEIGVVCGQCESFSSLGAEHCLLCSNELTLRKSIGGAEPLEASHVAAPPGAIQSPPTESTKADSVPPPSGRGRL